MAWSSSACGQAKPAHDHAFERDLFKTGFELEVKFVAAAIHGAWAAHALCQVTSQLEPFVLLSVHSVKMRFSALDQRLLRESTGMDTNWRAVWADEGAHDDLQFGDVEVAVNGRPLPGGGARFEIGALFKGGPMISSDDHGFRDVMLQARQGATAGRPMSLTLAVGHKLEFETRTGCAGSVAASAFDTDADIFWRQGNKRAKIPANALLAAQGTDELRWLAAFGTCLQASQASIAAVQKSEGVSNGFLVGKIFAIAVPGAGMLLSAVSFQRSTVGCRGAGRAGDQGRQHRWQCRPLCQRGGGRSGRCPGCRIAPYRAHGQHGDEGRRGDDGRAAQVQCRRTRTS